VIGEILEPPRPVDPQMRSLTKWRRMPWAIRVIEEGKDLFVPQFEGRRQNSAAGYP
jgi:hypothetical protein